MTVTFCITTVFIEKQPKDCLYRLFADMTRKTLVAEHDQTTGLQIACKDSSAATASRLYHIG